MFLYLSLLYFRSDILQIIYKTSELHYLAYIENRCIQKEDFSDLEKKGVKLIFASRTTIVFHLVDYDLVVKRKLIKRGRNQEGAVAVQINHDNIATTYITFKQRYGVDQFQWLIMEYMNYKLPEISKMKNDIKISICVSVCDALIYLHSRKIALLEVKPSNIGATIINNDNNKKREDALLHMYNEIKKGMRLTNHEEIYHLIVNKKYIEFEDRIRKTNDTLLDKFISYFFETNTDEKNTIITVNQTNNTGCDVVYKLLDFDLSRRYKKNKINRLKHNIWETYPDIALEIYISATFTLKTDVFNFGSLCYQLFYEKNLNKIGKDKNYIVDYETKKRQKNRKTMQNRRNGIDKIILSCISNNPSARPELTAVKQDLQNYEQSQSSGNPLQKKITIKKQ